MRPGRVLESEGGSSWQFTDIEVSINQVLAGKEDQSNIVLEIDQGLFPQLGTSDVWPKLRGTYILFLHRKLDNGLYRPTSSNGVLLVDGAAVRSEQKDNPLGASLDGASVDSIRAAIQDAVREIDAGTLGPAQPGLSTSPPTK